MKKDKNMNTAQVNAVPSAAGAYNAPAGKKAPKKKSGKGLKILAVILMCVLIAALAGILVFLLLTGSTSVKYVQVPVETVKTVSQEPEFEPGSVVINDKIPEKLDYKTVPERDGADFDFDGFFGYFGLPVQYSLTEDGKNVITVTGANQTAVFTAESTTVAVKNNATGKTYSVEISQAPYVDNEMTYFYIEDICYIFSDACVHYDREKEITYIYFGAEHSTGEAAVENNSGEITENPGGENTEEAPAE